MAARTPATTTHTAIQKPSMCRVTPASRIRLGVPVPGGPRTTGDRPEPSDQATDGHVPVPGGCEIPLFGTVCSDPPGNGGRIRRSPGSTCGFCEVSCVVVLLPARP